MNAGADVRKERGGVGLLGVKIMLCVFRPGGDLKLYLVLWEPVILGGKGLSGWVGGAVVFFRRVPCR